MNAKIIAALAIMAAFASLGSPVRAQSPETPVLNTENYQLTGDSLEGVGTRTAQDDFTKFFNGQNSGSRSINKGENNTLLDGFRLNEAISLPENPIILQPIQSMNGNDGVQVQLDLGNE
ncbi:hypothetical protein I8751_07965 [Nostocaceae cyanobacterium CENA357]|uniref:Uncharacterized protein n=1 Tax=Atlanticothrix silvestris CENA357 TaxID=1725252 RepID=A0A8J7L1A8_9CYAN|nr:hypothetical protein [Atlanticothrix silvestris]MBH8552309.1 hypothetical protein [Atlanticothrix silvestris CENA357]